MAFEWVKGHGTENDFVLLPDPSGIVHGALEPAFVAALCDRRRGIGADGVIRVIRAEALAAPSAGEWYMDYRNADGSVSEMCGNGIRVLARFLADEALVDPTQPVVIGTRDGDKTAVFDGDLVSIGMGVAEVRGVSKVVVDGAVLAAQDVRTGNPHAVAFVESLDQAGTLLSPPEHDTGTYPDGVNIEFVQRIAPDHIALRVHERGSGETRSCGTGACAAAVAHSGGLPGDTPFRCQVDMPGGTVWVTYAADGSMTLTGPAEIVARGTMEWLA